MTARNPARLHYLHSYSSRRVQPVQENPLHSLHSECAQCNECNPVQRGEEARGGLAPERAGTGLNRVLKFSRGGI